MAEPGPGPPRLGKTQPRGPSRAGGSTGPRGPVGPGTDHPSFNSESAAVSRGPGPFAQAATAGWLGVAACQEQGSSLRPGGRPSDKNARAFVDSNRNLRKKKTEGDSRRLPLPVAAALPSHRDSVTATVAAPRESAPWAQPRARNKQPSLPDLVPRRLQAGSAPLPCQWGPVVYMISPRAPLPLISARQRAGQRLYNRADWSVN